MIRVLFSCLLVCGGLAMQAQNLVDQEGRKTGHWKVDYPNGRTQYEADFVEGRPVGEMLRYHENGMLGARMLFEAGSSRNYTYLYYISGKPAAEGWYVDQLKDSVWTYYSEFDGSVRIRESYVGGKLNGFSHKYYPEGVVSEEVEWKENIKEGAWNQYYKNGVQRLSGHHKSGMLHGLYEVYYADETIKIRGDYLNNKSNGTWTFFDEDGMEIYTLEYVNGIPADQEKYDQWIQDSLKNYEITIEPDSQQQF